MIKTEKEYESTKKALEAAEMALLALKGRVYDSDPDLFQAMSASYVDYINKLRNEINSYLGLTKAEESSMPLWFRLKGPHIGAGNVPITVLGNFLTDFKLGAQRIVEYIDKKTPRVAGRPSEVYRKLTDFRVTILPGSVRIGISLPILEKQLNLDGGIIPNLAEDAVKELIQGVSWVTGKDERAIEEIFPEPEERRLILNQVDKISPQQGGEISKVEFTGRFIDGYRLLLSVQHSKKIKDAIQQTKAPENIEIEGSVREIDLDKKRFMLRDIPEDQQIDQLKEIYCNFENNLKEDAIFAIDKNIRVIGLLKRRTRGKPRLHLKQIEILSSKE